MQYVGSAAVAAELCVLSLHGPSALFVLDRKSLLSSCNFIVSSTELPCQTQFYQSLEVVIKVTNDSVIFSGEDNAVCA